MKVSTKESRKTLFQQQQWGCITLYNSKQTDGRVFPDLFKNHCREKHQFSQLDICLICWTLFFFLNCLLRSCTTNTMFEWNQSKHHLRQRIWYSRVKSEAPKFTANFYLIFKSITGMTAASAYKQETESHTIRVKKPALRQWARSPSLGLCLIQWGAGTHYLTAFTRELHIVNSREEMVKTINVSACSEVLDISCFYIS